MDNMEALDRLKDIGLEMEDEITDLRGTVSAVMFCAGGQVDYRLEYLKDERIEAVWIPAGRLSACK